MAYTEDAYSWWRDTLVLCGGGGRPKEEEDQVVSSVGALRDFGSALVAISYGCDSVAIDENAICYIRYQQCSNSVV